MKRWRRRLFAVLVLLLIAAVWMTMELRSGYKARAVSRAIADRVARHEDRIDFQELTDFDWDKVYCFDCYTGQPEIEKRLGIPWPGLGGSSIELSKGVTLIVFVKDGRVVRSFDHPRNQGDFGAIENPHGLTKDQARFVVQRQGAESWPFMRLADADTSGATTTTAPAADTGGK